MHRMMKARPKIPPQGTWRRISPIDPSGDAATKRTTSTWNALPQAAIHLVGPPNIDMKLSFFFRCLTNNVKHCFNVINLNYFSILFRTPHREAWTSLCCIWLPSVPQSLCWWMQGEFLNPTASFHWLFSLGYFFLNVTITETSSTFNFCFILLTVGQSHQPWQTRGGAKGAGRQQLTTRNPSSGKSFPWLLPTCNHVAQIFWLWIWKNVTQVLIFPQRFMCCLWNLK